jgi:hypothetical protein
MRVRVLTLQYTASLGGFDERPLADFVRDNGGLTISAAEWAPFATPVLTKRASRPGGESLRGERRVRLFNGGSDSCVGRRRRPRAAAKFWPLRAALPRHRGAALSASARRQNGVWLPEQGSNLRPTD